jgi:chromosome segregation ATPase
MLKRQRLEKLTTLQLQQKVIHLDSELLQFRSISEKRERGYQEQIVRLRYENENLRKEMQGVINEHNRYFQERDQLIVEYNKILLKNKAYQTKLAQLKESDQVDQVTEVVQKNDQLAEKYEMLVKLTEELRKKAQVHKENSEKLLKEKQLTEDKLEECQNEIIQLRKESKEYQQNNSGGHEWEAEHKNLETLLKTSINDREEILRKNEALQASLNTSLEQLTEKDESIENLQQDIMILQADKAEYKNMVDDLSAQNKHFVHRLEVLKENMEQITKKNVSYQQKITQLDSEKHAVLEMFDMNQTELSTAKTQLEDYEKLKIKLLKRLKNRLKETRSLEKENRNNLEEKAGLLRRIAILEEENTSYRHSVSELSVKIELDEKRLDDITSKLNEVFSQTKTIISTASSLQGQLKEKNKEIIKLKKENEKLMKEVVHLYDELDKSEARKTELENQIEKMKTELLKAQDSLTRLELFETEKLKLKEELETKIEEFNNLTYNYQREKESYLHVLDHVQDHVNEYKEKSELFDTEKGSWSKQIDELKTELAQTKATLVKMEELEQKNEVLTAELKAKEIEIYKFQKESEQTFEKQMLQFNSELKLYQGKITQYEKDRVNAENQMNEMKAKLALLESNLKEKENFIRQFITQPPSKNVIEKSVQPVIETSQESVQSVPSETTPNIPQVQQQLPQQQSGDWFQRNMTHQQGLVQNTAKTTNSTAMDFFTLRSKTTQPSSPGTIN